MANPTYFGKYRGVVADIKDPEQRGRIRVMCPSVLDDSKSNWCEPCIPFACDGNGDFVAPKIGDTTWVEFEEGNVNKPIWVGNWFSKNKTPLSSYDNVATERVITFDGTKITMKKDLITISTPSGAILSLDKKNIQTTGDSIQYGGKTVSFSGESTMQISSPSISISSGSSQMSMTDGNINLSEKLVIQGNAITVNGSNATLNANTSIQGTLIVSEGATITSGTKTLVLDETNIEKILNLIGG